MVSTGKGAEQGILIRSAESLETAHKIDTIVLDKTGTITRGGPALTDVVVEDDVDEAELLQLVASAEQSSEHPLAQAIVTARASEVCNCRTRASSTPSPARESGPSSMVARSSSVTVASSTTPPSRPPN